MPEIDGRDRPMVSWSFETATKHGSSRPVPQQPGQSPGPPGARIAQDRA